MFKEEARWINTAIAGYGMKSGQTVLDVGASNLQFRTVIQPHIHELIHKPLLEKGVEITFLDVKKDEGVDIQVDLSQPNLPTGLFSRTYDLIICCNILEHVEQKELFVQHLMKYAHTGTRLMVTVPLVYPRHSDPIDTMYRPTVNELAELIGRHAKCSVIDAEELVIKDREYYVLKPGRILDYLLLRSQRWLLRWYLKPLRWKVTCVLFEVQK